jgi:hypothetical protein
MVKWEVEFHRDFDPEFDALSEEVHDEIRAHGGLVEQFGPRLGRPWVIDGDHPMAVANPSSVVRQQGARDTDESGGS